MAYPPPNWIAPILKDPDTGRHYWIIMDRQGKWRAKAPQTWARAIDAERNIILLAQQLKVNVRVIKRSAETAVQYPDVRYSQ